MKTRITLIAMICLLFSTPAVGVELVVKCPLDLYTLDTDSGVMTRIIVRHHLYPHMIATAPDGRIFVSLQESETRHSIFAGESPIQISTNSIVPLAPFRTETGELEYTLEDPIYEYSFRSENWETDPLKYIYALAVKEIGTEGAYRVYFSVAFDWSADGQIYYVDDTGAAQPYYTVPVAALETPSCPGVGQTWAGNFTFDDRGNLYLTTGNTIPSALFRVSGAGDDTVTGEPEFVYERAGAAMTDLEFAAPASLYLTNHEPGIYRLDLKTFTEELVFTHPDGDDVNKLALLKLPEILRRFRLSVKRAVDLFSELRIASGAMGEPVYSKQGQAVEIPLRIVIENTSTRETQESFKIGAVASVSKGGDPFSVPFTVLGGKDRHFFWCDKMGAEQNMVILGKTTIESPDGHSLNGRNISITVQVDSCDQDGSMPRHCRVQEIDENNNTLQLNLKLPDATVQKR